MVESVYELILLIMLIILAVIFGIVIGALKCLKIILEEDENEAENKNSY